MKTNTLLKSSFHSTWHPNFSGICYQCLKNGRLDPGWSLYEHGPQVPAEGPQRWQRALKKPLHPRRLQYGEESLLLKTLAIEENKG